MFKVVKHPFTMKPFFGLTVKSYVYVSHIYLKQMVFARTVTFSVQMIFVHQHPLYAMEKMIVVITVMKAQFVQVCFNLEYIGIRQFYHCIHVKILLV